MAAKAALSSRATNSAASAHTATSLAGSPAAHRDDAVAGGKRAAMEVRKAPTAAAEAEAGSTAASG